MVVEGRVALGIFVPKAQLFGKACPEGINLAGGNFPSDEPALGCAWVAANVRLSPQCLSLRGG